jgi:DNA-directed RNA polymerase I subunit RPA2
MRSTEKNQRLPSVSDTFIDSKAKTRLKHLVAPHVDSFDYFLDHGLTAAIDDLPRNEVKLEGGPVVRLFFKHAAIGKPKKRGETSQEVLTPRECRERGISYGGDMQVTVGVQIENESGDMTNIDISTSLGDFPVMVQSSRCHLNGLSQLQLIRFKEEANEMGGYFITNGIERVIRLLQVPRRNYPLALERASFKNRGSSYSDKAVTMRCARPDQSSVTVTLHYLNNGGSTLRFVLRKQEFLLPVIIVIKSLVEITDKEIYDRIVQSDHANTFLTSRVELLLRDSKKYALHSMGDCRSFFGSLFRGQLPISELTSDEDAGIFLIERYLFVHTSSFKDKLEILFHMTRKLFSFAQNRCVAENADALMNHEILLPGHLITMYVKEKMEEILASIRIAMIRDHRINRIKTFTEILNSPVKYFQKQVERFGGGVGSKIATFLSTGNIVSSTGLDLMQVSGYTIVAERLNIFRYMSHFQSVHRGQYFTTMKTTTVRKLLPESWGFLCPVHTPDGSPCGLLNHLAKDAVIVASPTSIKLPTTAVGVMRSQSNTIEPSWLTGPKLKALLMTLGAIPSGVGGGNGEIVTDDSILPILVDGVSYAGIFEKDCARVVKELRRLKVCGTNLGSETSPVFIDPTIEIAYFPTHFGTGSGDGGIYPGIYISMSPGRMLRPVTHLDTKSIEYIGPMEQVFMDIACLSSDLTSLAGTVSHIEVEPTAMLSQIAALTPFSDNNQSPRNMYQVCLHSKNFFMMRLSLCWTTCFSC